MENHIRTFFVFYIRLTAYYETFYHKYIDHSQHRFATTKTSDRNSVNHLTVSKKNIQFLFFFISFLVCIL